ncbi:MAG TPA: hypothetical protein VHV82_15600 [Sporichthyaceae bacterium]|jgi:hypothetical protein|nr:hypothetical protein [Sporichthyaceae bacterium]
MVARGGLMGVVVMGCGLAAHTVANTARSTSAEVSDVPVAAVPAPAANGDLVPPLSTPRAGRPASPAVNPAANPTLNPIAQPGPSVTPTALALNALAPTAMPTAARIDQAAVARAKRYIGSVGDWAHLCLGFVRTTFGLPEVQSSAIRAWEAAKYKHRRDANPPAGVPVFWSGGSSGRGHVAVSLGDGWIVSTDFPYTGHIAKGRLADIAADWGLNYLGWTEDLEGERIYTPATALLPTVPGATP